MADPYKSAVVALDSGIKMHYLDWPGHHPPIIALHGSVTTAHMWDYLARNLSGAHRLLAPDMRGYGDSSPAASYTTADMVEDLKCFMDQLDLKDVHLMGHSMGTRVAGLFALHYQDRLKSLILVDTSDYAMGDPERSRPGNLFSRKEIYSSLEEAKAFIREHEGARWPEEILEHHVKTVTREANGKFYHKVPNEVLFKVRESSSPDFVPRAAEIKVPTLLLWGMESKVLLAHELTELASKIPHSSTARIPGAGHFIVQDQQDLFFEHLGAFLEKVGS